MSAHEDEAPPAGEEIHLPGPSLVPILNAVGLTLAIVGVTTYWIVSVAGALLFFFTLIRWIRDVRRDFDELPLEHHH
jgi:TRAP-type C4-dicarboxylate transport system permease small subunit